MPDSGPTSFHGRGAPPPGRAEGVLSVLSGLAVHAGDDPVQHGPAEGVLSVLSGRPSPRSRPWALTRTRAKVLSVLSERSSPRIVRRDAACGRGRPRWVPPGRRPPSPGPPAGWGFRRFCRVSGAEHRPAQPTG